MGKASIPMGKAAIPAGQIPIPAGKVAGACQGPFRAYFFTLVTMRKWRYSSVFTPSPASSQPSS
jgi:hypothetical protein